MHTGFRRGDLRGKDHLVGRGVDGKKILSCVLKKWDRWRNVYWTDWIQGGDSWRGLLDTVTNLRVLQCVPLATEPGISLIILIPMKILQRNLNSSTFVV